MVIPAGTSWSILHWEIEKAHGGFCWTKTNFFLFDPRKLAGKRWTLDKLFSRSECVRKPTHRPRPLIFSDRDTPVLAAVRANQRTVVKELLQMEADINAANKAGDTALTLAVGTGNTQLLQDLLAAGCNPASRTRCQKPNFSLFVAAIVGSHHTASLFCLWSQRSPARHWTNPGPGFWKHLWSIWFPEIWRQLKN